MRAHGRLGWFRLADSLLPRPARLAASCAALLAALVAAPTARAQDPSPIRVLVAVLPFQVNSSRPLAHLETSIADELTRRGWIR